MTFVGRIITNITSRYGILSSKAAERIAFEMGEKLLDKSNKLERPLTVAELNHVQEEFLPKRIRHRVIDDAEFSIECKKRGLDFGKISKTSGGKIYIDLINNTSIIWINMGDECCVEHIPSIMSHELFHAFRGFNNPIKNKINKVKVRLLQKCGILKKYRVDNITTMYNNIERHLKENFAEGDFGIVISQPHSGIPKLLDLDKFYQELIRDSIRRFIDPNSKDANLLKYDLLISRLRDEVLAHRVGAKIEQREYNLNEFQISHSKIISIIFEDAVNILKEERKLYVIRKLFKKGGRE